MMGIGVVIDELGDKNNNILRDKRNDRLELIRLRDLKCTMKLLYVSLTIKCQNRFPSPQKLEIVASMRIDFEYFFPFSR
jgi:hypothetical protein